MRPTRKPKLAPYLIAKDAKGLLRFVERALGGKLSYIVNRQDGTILHAEVRIADSLVMLADPPGGRGSFPAMMHLYVPNADASYKRAIKEGAKSVQPPAKQGDGDLRGGVTDAWGNQWWFTTPKK
jgi:PhnB protein